MACETGLDGDLYRLHVADLAHHHHVRILTQNGAQAAGEGHVDLGVDLRLANAVEVIFDRILDGENVLAAVVELHQRRVQRGGLARAGGPGHQHDPVGSRNDPLHRRVMLGTHAQLAQLQSASLFVQQAQHHPLTMA